MFVSNITIRDLTFHNLWDMSVLIAFQAISINHYCKYDPVTLDAIASNEQGWQEARYVDNNPVFETYVIIDLLLYYQEKNF